jgi:hypothetical protein
MRCKLLGIAVIAAMSLTACNIGSAATTSGANGGTDSGTKAAACARVGTIRAELAQIQDGIRQAMSGTTDVTVWGPVVNDLNRQKTPLNRELTAQNKVCKG